MTIDEVIQEKYKTEEKRREVYANLQEKLSLSRSQFWKKRKGVSPLSLEQAKLVSEVLKVPMSKLAAVLFVSIIAAFTGCKQAQPVKELDLQGCQYNPVLYYNTPALQHSEKCTATGHPFSEIIFLSEYYNQ